MCYKGDKGSKGIPGKATHVRINLETNILEYTLCSINEEPSETDWIKSDIRTIDSKTDYYDDSKKYKMLY